MIVVSIFLSVFQGFHKFFHMLFSFRTGEKKRLHILFKIKCRTLIKAGRYIGDPFDGLYGFG